ncbi:MAG: response regulator [Magnetococcales bacterium]|nr:response regulator [Magnetococcales bacterium]
MQGSDDQVITDAVDQQSAANNLAIDKRLSQANRALKIWRRISDILAATTDTDHTVDQFCRVFVQDAGYLLAWVGIANQDDQKSVTPIARYGLDEGYLQHANISWADCAQGRGPTGTAIRTATTCVARNIATEPAFAPWRRHAQQRGFVASIALPLKDRGQPFGALNLYSNELDAFDDNEVCLLEDLALQIARNMVYLQEVVVRSRVEQSLQQSEYRFRALFDNMPGGAAVYSALDDGEDFIIRDINLSGARVSRVIAADVIGQRVTKAFPGVKKFGLLSVFQNVHRTGQPQHHPVTLYQDNKIRAWFENYVYRLDSGEIVAIYEDRTGLKQVEETLRQSKEKAESATQAKSNFLATMSHEIRTPLNVILGLGDMLLESTLGSEQRHHVEIIQRSGQTLLSIINDILDFSRLEAYQFTLADIPFSPHRVIEDNIRLMQVVAAQKNLALMSSIDREVPSVLLGDDNRISQVLLNLTNNAIKFTNQGQITVRLQPHPQKQHTLLCSVADTGIGIAPEYRATIFDHFTQADTGAARRYGGTGLGLAISKRLVELMGGEIWLESCVDQGSTFYFTLPVRPAPSAMVLPPVMPVESHREQSLRILLAEDSPDNQMLFQLYLQQTSHQLVMVNNGAEAIARVKKQLFDLVIMDLQMPILDGYEATRQIRQWEQETERTPLVILALSAHAMEEQRAMSLAAGCNDHLTKPIKKKIFLEKLALVQLNGKT